ncbi:galactosyltransferase-related protein [Streptomyces sp. NPDC048718]|uniref:galactosyltransferase-related protein n=1 Tax=Streptomyces sp. NPDC048718 TaxID=3365587 RepID=UPI003720E438
MSVDVSVVIPLYGDHEGRRTLASVTRAWLGQSVPCEVVVAVSGPPDVTVAEDLSADRAVRLVAADPADRAPGLLRNTAAAHARAPVLYLTDADVLPVGRDFLARALDLAGGEPAGQPWQYRLLDRPDGVDPTVLAPAGSGRFCYGSAGSDGLLRPVPGERFTVDRDGLGEDVPIVLPPRGPGVDPDDPENRRPAFHWGGLMLTRQLFAEVGGYCRGYRGWGREDDDLLLKVAFHGPIVRAWRACPDLACLHFEHPRTHTSRARTKSNHDLYAHRTAAGPEAMIHEDRLAAGRTV